MLGNVKTIIPLTSKMSTTINENKCVIKGIGNFNQDNIKVKFVSVEQTISALGFRRVASVARKLNPKTEIYFLTVGNLYSIITHIFPSHQEFFGEEDLNSIVEDFSNADILCFSSMTPSSSYVEKIASAVKKKNPNIFILWGGTHCIIYPEEAIKYVDAICTWEGEIPFEIFYKAFTEKRNYFTTPSMWFNTADGIIKNKNLSLINSDQLEKFPHIFYDITCKIYDWNSKKFRQFTIHDYVKYNGLAYRTIWTIGCPYSCIYCANNAFINIDENYRKIRYTSVDYMIEEIEIAIKIYPFISTIVFYDDNFIALPIDILKDFSQKYKKRVYLPYVIFGLHPNIITEEKINILAEAGMNRGRMGIQSGNNKMLTLYNRQTSLDRIKKSAIILAKAARKYNMIPPAYDIISDNPLETREDIIETMIFLYELERPYTLTIFSLRVFPKTKLWEYFVNNPIADTRNLTSSYLDTRKTFSNILLYVLATFKPPKWIFLGLLKHVKGYQDEQELHPILHLIVKITYLISRSIPHIIRFDFTTINGKTGYYLWKIGLLSIKRK